MRKYAIPILLLIVLVLLLDPRSMYHSTKDRFIWNQMVKGFTADKVQSVQIQGPGFAEVDEKTKGRVLSGLREADFHWSNWQKAGPTPQITLQINFKDGSQQNFGYWGSGEFETWNVLGQFTVMNKQLGEFIENYAKIHLQDGRMNL